MPKFRALFLDIGGVLLTNGWDHASRQKAATLFELDENELEERHQSECIALELGQISLDEYLEKVIFWKKRKFTLDQFKNFILAQSQPYLDMMALMSEIKSKYRLRVVALSNEGRDLAEYRIRFFELGSFIDDFIISGFIGYQKPHPRIYQIALDITQTNPREVLYIDDRETLIAAGTNLGLVGIHHTSYESTKQKLQSLLKS